MTDFTDFQPRQVISEADARALEKIGVLAMDPERALPLWFDGRFLTARDLNREQNYFLGRQGAIGKAIGRGVLEGLQVRIGPGSAELTITAGQGIAYDGNHLIVPDDIRVNLADLAVQDAINAALGLSVEPGAPLRARTGVFVLALRAVEYTANDTAAFPTSLGGDRRLSHGDRIEAAAVTITPYLPLDAVMDANAARASAAMRLFMGGEATGQPGNALPLAMLALRGGAIEWADMYLVRRELSASRRDFLGLGLARDQLRQAHFAQYAQMLDDTVAEYARTGAPPRFPAEQHFRVLPAAGPLPAACVDAATQTQVFFPSEIEVELSIIPEDELPYLLDDSYELPPIDLTRPPSERDALSVMVLAPLPRHLLRSQIAGLGALARPLRALTFSGQGSVKPIERLGAMRIALAEVAAETGTQPGAEAWAALVRGLSGLQTRSGAPLLWYVRRRTMRENADLESVLVAIDQLDAGDDTTTPDPDGPAGPGPTPPPSEEPLDDASRAQLLRLSGTGDLVRILETQMRRVGPEPRQILLEVLASPAGESALSVAAATVRLGALEPGDAEAAKAALFPLATETDQVGVKLLTATLVGLPLGPISAARLKQLEPLVGSDLYQQAASAIVKIAPDTQKAVLKELAVVVETGAPDRIAAVVGRMVQIAEGETSPGPRPPTPPAEEAVVAPSGPSPADRAAEAEASARRAADALVKTLPDRSQAIRMQQVFEKSDAQTAGALAEQLTSAGLRRSRIATETVLVRLATGGRIGQQQLALVAPVNGRFVGGLAATEPTLLAPPAAEPEPAPRPAPAPAPAPAPRPAPAPAPRPGTVVEPAPRPSPIVGTRPVQPLAISRPATIAPITRSDTVSATIQPELIRVTRATPEDVVARRIRLIAGSTGVGRLAEFGEKNAANPTALKRLAEQLIPRLDDPNADTSTVARAIQSFTGAQ